MEDGLRKWHTDDQKTRGREPRVWLRTQCSATGGARAIGLVHEVCTDWELLALGRDATIKRFLVYVVEAPSQSRHAQSERPRSKWVAGCGCNTCGRKVWNLIQIDSPRAATECCRVDHSRQSFHLQGVKDVSTRVKGTWTGWACFSGGMGVGGDRQVVALLLWRMMWRRRRWAGCIRRTFVEREGVRTNPKFDVCS